MQDLSSMTGMEPTFLPWEHRVFIFIYLFWGCFRSLFLLRLFFFFFFACNWGRWWLPSSCWTRASHCGGFFCCRAWTLGHLGFSSFSSQALLLQGMWDLPGPRDQIPVLCFSRWIFYHWATREAWEQRSLKPPDHHGSSHLVLSKDFLHSTYLSPCDLISLKPFSLISGICSLRFSWVQGRTGSRSILWCWRTSVLRRLTPPRPLQHKSSGFQMSPRLVSWIQDSFTWPCLCLQPWLRKCGCSGSWTWPLHRTFSRGLLWKCFTQRLACWFWVWWGWPLSPTPFGIFVQKIGEPFP